MISCVGKTLLVATSLAPVCGAFAIMRIANSHGADWLSDVYFWQWTLFACSLVATTYVLLLWVPRHIKNHAINTTKLKPTDKDVLAFLIAYLMPLLGKDAFSFDKPIVAAYVYGLMFLAVFHSNSFHFNPMLALLGFHFYEIEVAGNYSALLISRKVHTSQESGLEVVKLTEFLLLEV